MYYLYKTKRESHLKQMLKPIKQNILNGEMLKRYQNVPIGDIKEEENDNQHITNKTPNSEAVNNTSNSVGNDESTTSTSIVNLKETLIEEVVDKFFSKLDSHRHKNDIIEIEAPLRVFDKEINQKISITYADRLKLMRLCRQEQEKKKLIEANNGVDPTVRVKKPYIGIIDTENLRAKPVYARKPTQHTTTETINEANLQPHEIKIDLKPTDQLEIDFDETKIQNISSINNNTGGSSLLCNNDILCSSKTIEIDIERPLNEIEIDYDKNLNEIKINLLKSNKNSIKSNKYGQKQQRLHNTEQLKLIQQPSTSTAIDEISDNNLADAVSYNNKTCNCVNSAACKQDNCNSFVIHDKNCNYNRI